MNMNEPPSLLRNDTLRNNHWLKVELQATVSNRSAIGARVTARYGGRVQVQELMSQSSFLSVNDKRLHFGLGTETAVDVEVRWPNGGKQTFSREFLPTTVWLNSGRYRYHGDAKALHSPPERACCARFQVLDARRRNFLIRIWQSALAACLRPLRAQTVPLAVPLVDAGFHLHPQYRSATPLDATLLKTKAGADDFVTEKYQDRIAAILAEWSVGLRQSPSETEAIAKCLAPGFTGSSLNPTESRIVRPGPAIEVRRIAYAPQRSLGRDAFLQELRSTLSAYSKIATAEFQITRIDVEASGGLRTRVRYELVGSGIGFHREQRVGYWELEWDQYRLGRWSANFETRSRSANPWYADIAEHAFGRTASWTPQMLRGVDYWRTVLDGASGIDICGCITASRSAYIQTGMGLTMFMFASRLGSPIGFIGIGAMELLTTSPRVPASACWITQPARFSPTSTTTASRI